MIASSLTIAINFILSASSRTGDQPKLTSQISSKGTTQKSISADFSKQFTTWMTTATGLHILLSVKQFDVQIDSSNITVQTKISIN